MSNELIIFNNAVKEQISMLSKSTGLIYEQIESKLISFAYETKKMIENSIKTKNNRGEKVDVQKLVEITLKNLDQNSIREAFKASLDTGIPVDRRQLAYVIKYGNTIQYFPGFKGYIYVLKKLNPTTSITTELVYEGDDFEVTNFDGKVQYIHKILDPFASIKKIIGVYCFIEYEINGNKHSFMERMSKEELEKIKSKAKTAFVWDEWYGEMSKKAVIRRKSKTLYPSDPIISLLNDLDNRNFDLKKEPLRIEYDNPIPLPKEASNSKVEIKNSDTESSQEDIEEPEIIPEENLVSGKIKSFEKRTGTKNGKQWTLTSITLEDGRVIKTFDNKDIKKGDIVCVVEFNGDMANKIIIQE